MASFCAWELLHTAMPKFVARFAVYAGVCGAAIVLGAAFGLSELVFKIAAYALFVTMFVEMMISFHKAERVPFQDLALVFTAGIVIPWMLSSLVRLGLNDPKAPYLLLPFVIAWMSDSGAFFRRPQPRQDQARPGAEPAQDGRRLHRRLCVRDRGRHALRSHPALVRLSRADRHPCHLRLFRQPCRSGGRPCIFRRQA